MRIVPNFRDLERAKRLATNSKLSYYSVVNNGSPSSQGSAIPPDPTPTPIPTITPTPTVTFTPTPTPTPTPTATPVAWQSCFTLSGTDLIYPAVGLDGFYTANVNDKPMGYFNSADSSKRIFWDEGSEGWIMYTGAGDVWFVNTGGLNNYVPPLDNNWLDIGNNFDPAPGVLIYNYGVGCPTPTPTITPTPTPTVTPTSTPTVPANALRLIAGDVLKTIDDVILTTIQ